MTESIGLRKGGRAAQERAKAEKAAAEKARAASFKTWDYLSLDAPEGDNIYGGSMIVRFVTDEPDWLEVKQHSWIPTKPAPKDKPSDKKWSDKWGAVCRYTIFARKDANGEMVEGPWFNDCFICDRIYLPGKNGKPDYHPKPTPRQWAWAIEREEVLGTKEMADAGEIDQHEVGLPVTYRDKLVDHVDRDGNTTKGLRWLVVNFAGPNFFDKLIGFANVYGTVVDRDYKITRKGASTETDYEIVALDPVTEEVNGRRVKYDLRRADIAAKYQPPVDLFSIISTTTGTSTPMSSRPGWSDTARRTTRRRPRRAALLPRTIPLRPTATS
jgi:hypothetical protein